MFKGYREMQPFHVLFVFVSHFVTHSGLKVLVLATVCQLARNSGGGKHRNTNYRIYLDIFGFLAQTETAGTENVMHFRYSNNEQPITHELHLWLNKHYRLQHVSTHSPTE